MRMEAEQPEQEVKAPPTLTEKLARLNHAATGELDDRRILQLPPEYAGLVYSDYAQSSGTSKVKLGGGDSDEWKTIWKLLTMRCSTLL